MFWIERITRGAQGFQLATIAPETGRDTQDLQQLATPMALGRTSRIRLTSDLATWSRESGRLFWEQLCIEKHHPGDGHTVFRFEHDGTPYLVPACIFIAALVRPIQRIYPYLFKPQGLESFSTPLLTAESPTVDLVLSPVRLIGSHSQTPKGLLATYSWLHSFPSAYAMWSSIYLAALQDRLDVDLPRAVLTMTLRSVKNGRHRLVTEMRVIKLSAQEAPYPFAADHTTDILMHEGLELDWQRGHRPESSIPCGQKHSWELSDEEWLAIQPLLGDRIQKKFELRGIIDLILVKFGTGHPWRKLDFGALNFPVVQATYQRMTKNGQWPDIAATLTTLRTPQIIPAPVAMPARL